MKKQILIITTILFVALCLAGAVSAESGDDNLETFSSDASGIIEPEIDEEQVGDVTISGQILKCSDNKPFSGATVTVSNNKETLASTITEENGQYQLDFQKTNTNFIVTATAPGHNPEHQEIKLEDGKNTYTANFQLGMDNVYVATTGNDTTGDGTQGKPYRTIGKGTIEVNTGGTVHVAAGTYNEVLTIMGKNLNLIGNNRSNTIIDAAGLNSCVITITSATVTISNFTIQNGNNSFTSTGTDVELSGGGIYIGSSGKLTINNCTIQNNNINVTSTEADAVAYGAGIYNAGTLTINNSTIQNNTNTATGATAAAIGGGIYNKGTLTITGSTIQNNTNKANVAVGSTLGGGIYNKGKLTINNSTIQNNINDAIGVFIAALGGGIYNCGASTIKNSSILKNTNKVTALGPNPIAHGGGIYFESGSLTANYNRIVGNSLNTLLVDFGTVDVRYNWWGSNNPNFKSLIIGTTNYKPWLTYNADLVMQSVTAPTTARRGRKIRVRNQVRNGGNISTGKGFYVAFYLRSTKSSRKYYLGRRWVGNLGVGKSSLRTNYFRIPKKIKRGRYYILAVADYTKRISETKRTNNIKYTTRRIRIT